MTNIIFPDHLQTPEPGGIVYYGLQLKLLTLSFLDVMNNL